MIFDNYYSEKEVNLLVRPMRGEHEILRNFGACTVYVLRLDGRLWGRLSHDY